MLTKKTRFVMIYIRIGFFRLPIILPLRCVHEIIEGYMDFLAPFRILCSKLWSYLKMAEGAALLVKNYEPFDLINISANSPDENGKRRRVEIVLVTR